jgi:hypothetical protein
MYFLNTAISIIIANAYLPSLKSALGGSWARKLLFGGHFPDLTPKWYQQARQG